MHQKKKDRAYCDGCGSQNDDQVYVGYGMFLCEKCLVCKHCKGRGYNYRPTRPVSKVECRNCNGTGEVK